MLFAVLLVLLGVSFMEATRCDEYKADKVDYFEAMDMRSNWLYVLTNHFNENCDVAEYTEKGDNWGTWNVMNSNSSYNMNCLVTKSSGKKLNVKVQQSGANYTLAMTAYSRNERFCWFQCDVSGKYVDFFHCFAADDDCASNDEIASPNFFRQFFKSKGLKKGPFTRFMDVYNPECAEY